MVQRFAKGFFVSIWIIALISALLSLAGTGIVVYILYRIATHPW